MKGPTWERLTRKYILPDLPDWAVKGRLMFRVPIGAMLQATLLDGSIDPNGGYLHVFVQPLFVPSDTIVIDYGMRLRHDRNEYWPISADAPEAGVRAVGRALRTDALPFLDRLGDARSFAWYRAERRISKPKPRLAPLPERRLEPPSYPPIVRDPRYVLDVMACHLWVGDEAAARTEFAALAENPPYAAQPSLVVPLLEAAQARCDWLIRLLDEGGVSRTRALLEEWRRYTITNLRLEKWADPDPA